MKRVVFAVLWTFVFWFLCAVAFGVVAAFVVKGDAATGKAAVDAEARKWVWVMFLGSFALSVVLSGLRVLPGTRRRPASTAGRGVLADSDFPPARPTIAVPVGTPDDPPPELAALGPPISVHLPGRVTSMSGFTRLLTFVLGLFLIVAPAHIIDAVGSDQFSPTARKVLLIGGVLAGLMCLVIAIVPRSPYAYQIHHDALVVSSRKTTHIVPWDQIQALIPELPFFKDLTVVTRDGLELPINTSVNDVRHLRDTVFLRVRDHLLPLMLKSAFAGRMVEFGPLAISSYAMRCKGDKVPWEEVNRVVIVYGSGFYKLMIYHRSGLGVWPFCRLNLNTIPNDQLLLEVLKQILPPRLLVTDQAKW